MEKSCYDAVILSDLHLGSDISRAKDALTLLRSLRFNRLILLGDIFCDLNFRRLTKEHWEFLSHIRILSNPRRDVDVVWVEGNHDRGLSEVMSHLVGVPVYQEYRWESAGVRNIAIHGHQFDDFILNNHWILNALASHFYLLIQRISPKGRLVARFLDEMNTHWQRLTPKVAEGALTYARLHNAKRIFCGHTHQAVSLCRKEISYYNCGAWTNSPSSYITILGQEVTVHDYFERVDDHHTGEKRRKAVAPAA